MPVIPAHSHRGGAPVQKLPSAVPSSGAVRCTPFAKPYTLANPAAQAKGYASKPQVCDGAAAPGSRGIFTAGYCGVVTAGPPAYMLHGTSTYDAPTGEYAPLRPVLRY